MRLFLRKYLKEFYYWALYNLSHPLFFTIAFLLPNFKFDNSKRLMVAHVVYGLFNYKLYALLAVFGLIALIISYSLFNRAIAKEAAILNLIGSICMIVAFKIVQMDDDSNFRTRDLYNGFISSAMAIFSGLFTVYNLIAWGKWNVKQFVEDIWAEEEEERKRLN